MKSEIGHNNNRLASMLLAILACACSTSPQAKDSGFVDLSTDAHKDARLEMGRDLEVQGDGQPPADAELEADAPEPSSRSFLLGFTPQPHAFTQAAVDFVYQGIAKNADLIVHHLDDGVPWPEMLSGAPFPPEVQRHLDERRNNTPPGHKILLTATATSQDRATLAGYWNKESHEPLPQAWQGKNFDDPDVATAYTNYCSRLIDFFKPSYFAYGIEVNGTLMPGESQLTRYLQLTKSVYASLKKRYPSLPIMVTVQTIAFGRTHQQVLDVARAFMPYSDYIALSTYPYWLPGKPTQDANPALIVVKDWLDDFKALAPQKPMAITETGYIAEDFLFESLNVNIKGSADWQKRYVALLFQHAQRLDLEFINWFVMRDYDALWELLQAAGYPDWFKTWKDTGLYDGEGNERPALELWRAWLARPRR